MRHQGSKGFTLIELMIVIAILAILLAIAIPAYQNYTIRTKVSEAIHLAAPVKIAVVETLHAIGGIPDQGSTGVGAIESDYVASIVIANDGTGTVTLTTRNTGAQTDPVITLTPDTNPSTPTTWECQRITGANRHVPAACRQ